MERFMIVLISWLVLAALKETTSAQQQQCFQSTSDCSGTASSTGMSMSDCCASGGMSHDNGSGSCMLCPADPMCYTEACNCTGNTSNTSPTDMNHCCSGGLNGVSFSDANGICSPCPGDCHSTTADCTGTIMANGMGVSERRCCSTLGGTSFDVNGQCFECTGGVYCGQDPHFAVPLSDGQLLCYSVQGLAYFAFNLISDPTININAYFIPPEKKEDFKEYATFLGDIGIMIQPNNCEGKCKTEDITKITISASDRSVLLDGSRTVLSDRPVHVMVDNTTATIQLGEKLKKGEHPNMIVSVKKPTLSFKVNFVNEHLDLAVMDDNGISDGCHGIMGQFLRREPEIENGVLRLNGRQIETEEKAAWDFLRTEKMCLHAKPLYGYQAEGIIEGKYTDYIVESIFSPHFQYSKFKL